MPFFKVNYSNDNASFNSLAGFNNLSNPTVTGAVVADLLDTSDNPTGYTLSHPTAFAGYVFGDATSSPDPDFPVGWWNASYYVDVGADIEISGLPPGAGYTIKIGGNNGSSRDTQYSVNNGGSAKTYVDDGALDPVEAPVSFTGTVPPDGTVIITLTEVAAFCYINGFSMDVQAASTPTITNIDTDNAVNQYQQGAVIALSDFTESITSVTLNGVTAPIQSQVVGTSVTVDLPGSLATGSYDLVVSGATETDTLTGVSYTQTHARPAFDGLVDSNSILSGQSYTADTYFKFVTSFTNGTLDTAAGDAREWQDDIADYYTPNEGFTGDDTASIEFLYSDGTTSATVGVTITVSADSPEPPGIAIARNKRIQLNIGVGL